MKFGAALKHNLTHLLVFEGRDARQTFWFYVLFLMVIQFGVGMLLTIPMMVSLFTGMISGIQSGAEPEELTRLLTQNMMGYMKLQMWGSAVIGAVTAFLLTASFVRRLHDAGFTGWIVLIPLTTQFLAVGYSIWSFDQVVEMLPQIIEEAAQGDQRINTMTLQAQAAPFGLIGWVGYIAVIGFGVLRSQEGPNKYGEYPEATG